MMYGFSVQNEKLRLINHPIEDSFCAEDSDKDKEALIGVADGVTRDPCLYLPDCSSLYGKIYFLLRYAIKQDKRAKIASDLAASLPVYKLREHEVRDEKALRKSIGETSKVMARVQREICPNPDYLVNDYPGAVLAVTARNRDSVAWAYLSDCGIAICNKNGDIKKNSDRKQFKTEDEGPSKHDAYIWADERLRGKNWGMPKARRIIRKYFRNNPSQKHSFGVLTGEETALSYLKTGTWEIEPTDFLLVYSDGLEPLVSSGKIAETLRARDFKGLEMICGQKVKTEGTLVIQCPGD